MSALKPGTRLATQRVRHVVLREIERRSKAQLAMLGEDFTGRIYRAALADLAGWLEGADVEELLGIETEPTKDVPSASPIDAAGAKLAWLALRNNLDAATNLKWQNSLDVLDLFFGFDARARRPRR